MRGIGILGLGFILFLIPLFIVLAVVPYWKIFEKAGWSGALSLLMLVPLANLVVLWVFAFSDWPALRDRRP
jgi:hypothetical protein